MPRRLLRVVGPFLAFGVGAAVAPSRDSVDFFAATAQIIPVLLLLLAWEADVFRWRSGLTLLPPESNWLQAAAHPDSWWHFATRGLVFLTTVYAEVISLRGLGGERVGEINVRVICGSIVACLGGIAALTLLPPGTDARASSEEAPAEPR